MEVTLDIDQFGIGRVTLDHPRKRNILSHHIMEQLGCIINDIKENCLKVKALIIHSKYPEFFSAGGDIREWHKYSPLEAYDAAYRGGKILSDLEDLPIFTIAAISGSCLGGGGELALACDMRICTTDAKFGQPEVLLGNGTSWGGYYRLARTVGISMAKEMILLGQTYTASEAKEFGLVNCIVSDFDELIKVALETARKAAINHDTIKISKLILNQIQENILPTNFIIDTHTAAYFAGTETSKIRKQAFLDKRLGDLLESKAMK